MKSLHIKNLEKYHPKFRDRNLVWCKLYFSTLNTDPAFMLLDEIDKWRYFAFVMLELQMKKPVPLEPRFLILKGFDLSARKIDITVNAIRELVEIDIISVSECHQDVPLDKEKIKRRVDKEEDKEKEQKTFFGKHVNMYLKDYNILCDRFNKLIVDESIEQMNDWISAKEKKPFKDFAAALRNWIKNNNKTRGYHGKSKENNTDSASKFEGIGKRYSNTDQ